MWQDPFIYKSTRKTIGDSAGCNEYLKIVLYDEVDKDRKLMLSEFVKHRLEEVEGATVRVSLQGTVVHNTQLQTEFSFCEYISYPLKSNFESFVQTRILPLFNIYECLFCKL